MISSLCWYITPCSLLKPTEVSKEYIALIFRVVQQTKQETNMKQAGSTICLLHAVFLLGLLFNHEDGSDMFFRNIS
jgi:hypothetical protein